MDNLEYGFYDSNNGDRKYTASQFTELIGSMIEEGVFENIGQKFNVTPIANSGTSVTVGSGRGWFSNIWLKNPTAQSLDLQSYTPSTGQSRIDAVVIFVDKTARTAGINVINGTPGTTPARPSIPANYWPIAYIKRTGSTIVAADITNVVGTSECPFITATMPISDVQNVLSAWDTEYQDWMGEKEQALSAIFVPEYWYPNVVIATISKNTSLINLGNFTIPKGLVLVTAHVHFDDDTTRTQSGWRGITLSSSASSSASSNQSFDCATGFSDGSITFITNNSSSTNLFVNGYNSTSLATSASVRIKMIRLTENQVSVHG